MLGRLLLSLAIGLSLSLASFGVERSRGNSSVSEHQVKAKFLYHFTHFIHWPQNTFASPTDDFTICLIEGGGMRRTIHQTLKGKTVKKRGLDIKIQSREQDHSSCHLVYVGSLSTDWFAKRAETLKKNHILTIGESESFIKQGGMIQFYVDNNKIRFAINPNAMQEGNLKASSKLLRLAKIVKL